MINNDKQAVLIIANRNFEILLKLISLLDNERIDFYVHIDKKDSINFAIFDNLVKKSNLFFIKRRKVSWGSFAMVKVELDLLEEARKHRKYQYYHLLSGSYLPLKDVDQILNFFDTNNGFEFVKFSSKNKCENDMLNRINIYYPPEANNKILQKLRYSFIAAEKKYKVDRLKNVEMSFYKWSQWFSITDNLVSYIISKKRIIYKLFQFGSCVDELFMQTLIHNSLFYEKTYFVSNKLDEKDCRSNMRCIKWNEGDAHPYVWRVDDLDDLLNSDCLFARKFDFSIDKEIIEKLYGALKNG